MQVLEILKGQDGEEKVDFGQFKVDSLKTQLLQPSNKNKNKVSGFPKFVSKRHNNFLEVSTPLLKDFMGDLEKAGWKKANGKSISNISDKDVKAIFRICDTDKSGSISDRVG